MTSAFCVSTDFSPPGVWYVARVDFSSVSMTNLFG